MSVDVRALLPHRYPIALVDRVVTAVPGEWLVAVKAVTGNEPCYHDLGAGATREQRAYPPSLLLESWAQAAAVLDRLSRTADAGLDGKVLLFGSVAEVEFGAAVYPGSVVEHHVRLVRALTDTVIFEGECRAGAAPVMTVGRMVMAIRPAEQVLGARG